ncbi:MAG: hypothetical protein JRI68_01125, partial [Deltaproteobacteria bacterium]|nr:hypothetical protein [Deltaproteobacteria bacterium]
MRQLAILGGVGAIWLVVAACDSDGDGGGTGGTQPTGSGGDAAPAGTCGNDVTEPGEACDGTDLNGHSCATLAAELTAGTLACRADCSGYDIAPCEASGQTIEAASCEQEDVQAAIDSASDGDTVSVPAGQCTWQSAAGCDGRVECAPVAIVGKAILLRGAGQEQTVITTHVPEGWQYSSIYVASEADKPFRISGFGFLEVIAPAISVSGDNQSFRIDHLSVRPPEGESIVAVEVTGSAYGVIDHGLFETAEILVLPDEDDAWNRPLSLGTVNAVYVEDSAFVTAGAINDVIDGRSGARFVFRYNEVTNLELHCHGIEGGGDRGTHSYELYSNTGICDGATNCYRTAYLRGGTGVVFDNAWSGDWSMSGLHVV